MSSLAELRRRLACLDKRPQSDTGSVDILVKPDTSPENRANGNTGTIEITGKYFFYSAHLVGKRGWANLRSWAYIH